MIGRPAAIMAVVAALLAAGAGCGLQSGGALPLPVGPGSIRPVPALRGVQVTVGSKDFTEQIILGYLIEFALAAAGADVRDLTDIEGSNSTRDAQLHGQVDVTYDYTGTGWINYLGNQQPIPDSVRQFDAVRDQDLARHHLVWTDMAPLNNTYALATSPATAARTGVVTLSGYARLVAADPAAAATCVGTEFNVRPDGFPGMAARYGIAPGRATKHILQDPLVYQATADASQCRFGSVATTDGRISALHLVILDDDRHFFPKYNAALVIRESFARAHPDIATIMAPISALLTNDTMTALNRQVDVDGREPADVARDWLVAHGFVTK